MQWRAKWIHVAIALGVVAALAVASPVFAVSSSIKKAIKKEVAKQLENVTGPTGPPGATGSPGTPGTGGAAGSARAYGLVSDLGALSRSQGVTSVTQPFGPDQGEYCIVLASSIDADSAVLLVAPDSSDNETSSSSDDESYVEWNSEGTDCPPNALEVFTYLYNGDGTDNGTGSNTTGDDLALNDESFSFMVP